MITTMPQIERKMFMRKQLGLMPMLGLVLARPLLATPSFAGTDPTAKPEQVTIYVLPSRQGLAGPDGRHHDSFVPSDTVLQKGVPAELRIINYDDGPHTMYAPALGLDVLVMPGKRTATEASERLGGGGTDEEIEGGVRPAVTKVTFTPAHIGFFRWHCAIPCAGAAGHWAMCMSPLGPGQDGYMAGYFVVR